MHFLKFSLERKNMLKKNSSTLFNAVLLASLLPLSATAEENSGFTLTPSLGYFMFDEDRQLEDDAFASLGLGYRFDSPWELEAVYAAANTENEAGVDSDFRQYRLDGLYHLESDGKLTPYLAAGYAYNDFENKAGNDDTRSTVNGGGGVNYSINENASIRGDIRAFLEPGQSVVLDLAFSLGLRYAFAEKAAPAPVIGDGDNDGVLDNVDQCPATPAGVTVDAKGCGLDDDNDGVANHLDDCPSTPAGAKVDAKGCAEVLAQTVSVELEVLFANDADGVPESAMAQIKEVSDFMTSYPNTDVVVEGHTDSRGAEAYNQSLSERRAKSVAKVLVEKFGVASNRVAAAGYGEAKPIADNGTAAGRAENRRVVAVISTTTTK